MLKNSLKSITKDLATALPLFSLSVVPLPAVIICCTQISASVYLVSPGAICFKLNFYKNLNDVYNISFIMDLVICEKMAFVTCYTASFSNGGKATHHFLDTPRQEREGEALTFESLRSKM